MLSLSLSFEELQNNLDNHVMCISLVVKLGPKQLRINWVSWVDLFYFELIQV
jgi:hypothetical protein